MSKAKGARKADGNITVDLGEALDRKIRAAGSGREGRKPQGLAGYRPGGSYRPGMFGGYRPWHSSGLGRWNLGAKMGIPDRLETSKALTGALLGAAGNRLVVRFVPDILGTNSKLAAEAVAFGVGIVPFLAQRNSMTVGIALPGLVFLAGSLADYAFDQIGVPAPAMSGARVHNAAAAARQRLAELQHRIAPQARGGRPVVSARPA